MTSNAENADLATAARAIARRSLTAARRALAEDCPDVSRAAALAALSQLAKEAAA